MRQQRLLTCLVVVAILIPSLSVGMLGNYLLISFAFQTIHVRGSAMSPTIDDSDYLIAERLPYRLHSLQRGDIVVVRDPYNPSRGLISG